jgi:hypothetical protein
MRNKEQRTENDDPEYRVRRMLQKLATINPNVANIFNLDRI